MESSSYSSSNPSTIEEELDLIFLDAPDEFYYDCFPIPQHSSLRRRKSAPRSKFVCSGLVKEPPLSSDVVEVVEESSCVEESDDLDGDFASKVLIEVKDNDFDVIDSVNDQEKDLDSGPEKVEESTVTTMSDDGEDEEHAVSGSEPGSSDWSVLGFLVGLLIKAIEFQVSLMISLISFPSSLLLFVSDPFRTIRFGRRFLIARVTGVSDLVLSPFKSLFKDTKDMVNVACKFGWGLFWAVYVGIVLFGLLVTALMCGGVVINRVADKPFVVKESLNFDYTKNSPEAFVPVSSCAGVSCDGSCEESNEMGKIRGKRVIPRDQKLEITLAMTLPESVYNKNLGMFQVRVDFLSADGQRLASIRRPCMLRFRSEPIRLVQTMFKVVPLVTGYVSEIQTLSLKLKGFVEKEIPTACLKIMIEQRAEFRPGAGIPELYDASLSIVSDLPFFKRIIWKWRKTLFVWISMSVFITELLFALACCRPLIIPRRRRRDPSPSNPTSSRL